MVMTLNYSEEKKEKIKEKEFILNINQIIK